MGWGGLVIRLRQMCGVTGTAQPPGAASSSPRKSAPGRRVGTRGDCRGCSPFRVRPNGRGINSRPLGHAAGGKAGGGVARGGGVHRGPRRGTRPPGCALDPARRAQHGAEPHTPVRRRWREARSTAACPRPSRAPGARGSHRAPGGEACARERLRACGPAARQYRHRG